MQEMTVLLSAVVHTSFSSEEFVCIGRKQFKNMTTLWNFGKNSEANSAPALKLKEKKNVF
jgi:hypothetical protein